MTWYNRFQQNIVRVNFLRQANNFWKFPAVNAVLTKILISLFRNYYKINPKTPYDVEEKAESTIQWSTDNDIFNSIKNYLYYGPEYIELSGVKIEVSIFQITHVMGLYLRDIYLEKHPDLIPAEMENQNPETCNN